jgi:hypothetical protein
MDYSVFILCSGNVCGELLASSGLSLCLNYSRFKASCHSINFAFKCYKYTCRYETFLTAIEGIQKRIELNFSGKLYS